MIYMYFVNLSGEIFEDFLETEVCKLAQVPVVIAVHAPSDLCSSFRDVAASDCEQVKPRLNHVETKV